MKRFKRIYILLGVLALFSIAAVVALRTEEYRENIRNSDEIILELAQDTVDTLSWEYEGETLSFHKNEEGQWIYDGDEAFPVDPEKIEGFLERFEAFGVSFVIEDVEDYGQYGLEDPLCTVTLTSGDTEYTLTLGDYSTMDAERYVSIGDGNAYLVPSDPLDDFDATLEEMILDDETPVLDQVDSIQFSGAEEYTIVYEEESSQTYCSEDVYFAQADAGDLPLDTGRVESYLSNISYLDLSDFVTYNATEEELASYGLDTPDLSVTLQYMVEDEETGESREETFVLHLSRDPEEAAAEEAAAAETEAAAAEAAEEAAEEASAEVAEEAAEEEAAEEAGSEEEEPPFTAYARVGESQIVYQISEYYYEALMAAAYDDLRHEEVFTADFDTVYQLDFTLEGSQYTITSQVDAEASDEAEATVRTYYYQEEELDLTGLQTALQALAASSFTQEQPAEKEEIRFTAYLENENFPTVEVILYRYDGENCLAVVDGEPVSLVPRSQVVDLIEALNAIVL